MGNSRPLQNLSDEQLLELWSIADKVDDFAHETIYHIHGFDVDCFLNGEDVQFIRAGLLLHAKLCDKFGIPYPKMEEDDLSVGDYEELLIEAGKMDEWNYGEMPLEVVSENLHAMLNAFTSIDGIGDFSEEYLRDPRYLLELEESDPDKVSGEFEEELEYIGYLSYLEMVREFGVDAVEIEEIMVTKSKKMASFMNAATCGAVPETVTGFMEGFQEILKRRTCYYMPADTQDEVKEDTWCCVHAIIQHYEEGILICDLYKIMSTRIGAYIAQEFAERYA